MKKLLIIPLLLIFILTGCSLWGIPVPKDKKDFVGTWSSGETKLIITHKGELEYEEPGFSLNAPIQEFTDDHITAGVWFINKTFTIDKAPYEENGVWKMQIDGDVLIKSVAINLQPIITEPQTTKENSVKTNQIKRPEIKMPPDRQTEELYEYLYENVPEVKELEQRIMTYAEEDVGLIMYIERELNYLSDNPYERDYYQIYIGEDHQGTRQVNVYRFLIHKDTKEILHIDPITFDPETLEEWREKD